MFTQGEPRFRSSNGTTCIVPYPFNQTIVENPEVDKSTNFGFSYPKGSWLAVMKVDSDEVWNDYIKTGKVQGFSIDAMLSLEEVNLKSNIENKKYLFLISFV